MATKEGIGLKPDLFQLRDQNDISLADADHPAYTDVSEPKCGDLPLAPKMEFTKVFWLTLTVDLLRSLSLSLLRSPSSLRTPRRSQRARPSA
jgi:hypothetical protein